MTEVNNKERLAKYIARAGYASRRDAEKLIFDGKVKVNGELIIHPAFLVNDADNISINNVKLATKIESKLYAFYKPAGYITTKKDEMGRPTIYDLINKNMQHLQYVGRLDLNSEGLLLLTNDGELARKLTTSNMERIYKVRCYGNVSQKILNEMQNGVVIDGVTYNNVIAKITHQNGKNLWIDFTLIEGKNREIRNIVEHLGLRVNRLMRISFGKYQLEDLKEGELRELKIYDIN